MGTITAAKAGNWSDITVWNGGVVPGNLDTADLNGFVIAMDIPTIPASGVLAGIISPGKAGQLTLALDSVGNSVINATTITPGTIGATGFIRVNGNTTNTFTLNGDLAGGPSVGIYYNSTGPWVLNGDILPLTASNLYNFYNNLTATGILNGKTTGGISTNGIGLYNKATGNITINDDITGGTGTGAYGFQNVGGEVTLNNCNLINGTGAVAYAGKPPTTWNLNANNYIQWGAVKFPQQLLDHQVLAGVVHGDITGNRVDCPVAKAIESSGNYGDPASPLVGTYHEADVSEVKKGVMFGAASALEGTYDHYPIIGGSHIIQPARAA